jgi:hypothetical protein
MKRGVDPDSSNLDRPEGARMMQLIEHAAIISLAGPVAVKRFNPRSHRHVGGGASPGKLVSKDSDYQQVLDLIYRVYGNGKVHDIYWRYVEARAEALVEKHWKVVKRLASALVKRETMITRQEILEVLNEGQPPILLRNHGGLAESA